MTVRAKICGLSNSASVRAAVDGGAAFVGFVFYPQSPRAITPEQAARLAALVPVGVGKVGLFVDADDASVDAGLAASLDLLQLHGGESPDRVAALRRRTGVPVMKAISVAGPEDVQRASAYYDVADWLMFDAKPPKDMRNALPGGNALAFDWTLLGGHAFPLPWMLAGGLRADNLAEAVRLSGARVVDTSSGIEDRPGIKNDAKIADFLKAAAALD